MSWISFFGSILLCICKWIKRECDLGTPLRFSRCAYCETCWLKSGGCLAFFKITPLVCNWLMYSSVFKCIQVRSGVFRRILWKFAVCFKIGDLSNPVNFDRRRVTGAFANRQQGDPTGSITFSHLRLFEDYTLSRWSDYSVTTSANRLLISPLLRSVCVPQVWSSRLAGGEGDNRIESTDRLVRTVKLESRRASNNWN